MRAAAARPEPLRGLTLALLIACAAAAGARAQEQAMPSCDGLVPRLKADPSSIRNGTPLVGVDAIVEDLQSTPASRICTAAARYKSGNVNITFTAKFSDDKHLSFSVDAHDATVVEATSRARALRAKSHPPGQDGTFSFDAYVPYCTDAEFIKLATAELHYGISFRDAFYREPDFRILDISSNGYGSGILSNCIATVGNGEAKGAIFIGTNWVNSQTGRRYEFYVLASGPDGFKLKNRLWETGAE
ncbi:MAG TPA: hypothetical protein VN802_20625 [Stellaceae bacterium]|nr:hypothetical protein [Stellaceae bacterium]